MAEFDLFRKYQELALKLRVPDEKLLEWVESKVQADLDVQEKKLRAEETKLARARELAEAEEKTFSANSCAGSSKITTCYGRYLYSPSQLRQT
ncbi:hypothetical protein PoB_006214100 [Plakobranchus ocellatus]|uniref:Uncharacterized protein n=1 Tax=Plakobranchus ocellatus TaxID=259542 RepID=A0AAV4CUP8_9GAST|nr:hypothetical protein PoB_006214100 [Plakobranchus ocellatus]